jgi:hypothetical protein
MYQFRVIRQPTPKRLTAKEDDAISRQKAATSTGFPAWCKTGALGDETAPRSEMRKRIAQFDEVAVDFSDRPSGLEFEGS